MKSILTTTTDNLEGWEIKQYFQPVSSNIVVGANMFSDFSASITDFFGGRSTTYEKKLQEIYVTAIDKLKAQLRTVGANCIVGLRVDIGEISGKGTQMFMITAIGTPVFAVKMNSSEKNAVGEQIVDGTLVERKIRANSMLSKFEKDELSLTDENINFILETAFPDFGKIAIAKLKTYYESESSLIKQMSRYLGLLDAVTAKAWLYESFTAGEKQFFYDRIIDTIVAYDLIDYKRILEILRSNDFMVARQALALLNQPKPYYSPEDKVLLEEIAQVIESRFPIIAEKTTKKKMFSSSEVPAWKCPCGKVNDVEATYCADCSKDKYGFKENEFRPNPIKDLLNLRLRTIENLA
jgi:uncharacterized protein YbjQ (UPF0145 family)